MAVALRLVYAFVFCIHNSFFYFSQLKFVLNVTSEFCFSITNISGYLNIFTMYI